MKKLFVVMALAVALIGSAQAGKIGPKQSPDGPIGIEGTSLVVDGKIGPKQRPDAEHKERSSILEFILNVFGRTLTPVHPK